MEGVLNFYLQVINAARVLAARPKSKVAQENIDVFRDAWINQVFQYFINRIYLSVNYFHVIRYIWFKITHII